MPKPKQLPWSLYVDRQLSEFSQLRPGWDSYGARPISSAAIEAARRFLTCLALIVPAVPRLPQPRIVPLVTGGVQLEWDTTDGGWTEIEFHPDGSVQIDAEDLVGNEWDVELPALPRPAEAGPGKTEDTSAEPAVMFQCCGRLPGGFCRPSYKCGLVK